jgi:hypothetical protein
MDEKSDHDDSFGRSVLNSTIKDRVLSLIIPSFREISSAIDGGTITDRRLMGSIKEIESRDLFSEFEPDEFNESFINSL